MPKSTITSKGQITIPKMVREALAVEAGDQVSFIIAEDGTIQLEAATVDLRNLRGSVRTGVKEVTVESMNETIRKAAIGE